MGRGVSGVVVRMIILAFISLFYQVVRLAILTKAAGRLYHANMTMPTIFMTVWQMLMALLLIRPGRW